MNRKTILLPAVSHWQPKKNSFKKSYVEHATQGITMIPSQLPMDGLALKKVNTFVNSP